MYYTCFRILHIHLFMHAVNCVSVRDLKFDELIKALVAHMCSACVPVYTATPAFASPHATYAETTGNVFN